MRIWMWQLVGLSLAFGAIAFAADPARLRGEPFERETPSLPGNAFRIHAGALMTTKNDAFKFGPSVGVEVLRYTRTAGVAVGMEVSVLQAGGRDGLFDGLFTQFAENGWGEHKTSAIFVLPTLTLRPRSGSLRPYLALGVGPALFRQEATNARTRETREADAFRLVAVARAGVDIAFFDRLSLVVEPLQVGRVAGEWTYGSRASLGVNF